MPKNKKVKNARIRRDMKGILRDAEMTAEQIRMELIKINDDRYISNQIIGQVLRSKEFEKAKVLPTLTAVWKLKEE